MEIPISKLLNPSYDLETKKNKTQFMLKLSYDTIFYSIATICSYLTFKDEHWFPKAVGGCGSCSQIYQEYPNWP